jgi:protein-tyrosine kinase
MSAEAEHMLTDRDRVFAETLISLCALTPDSVQRISDTMRTAHLSFREAALHIGLASPEQIEDATAWAERETTLEQPGLIETALRRTQSKSRALVRQGGVVRPSSELTILHDPDNPRCEKIRALRTELMFLMEGDRRNNVIVLMSPSASEGRSQLCAELAIAFAQLQRRTLLIDADLRHPRQHVLFNADNQWGLAQALSVGDSPFFHEVEGVPDLTVLTAGTLAPNPLELVSNRRLERMLTDWRRNFHFVIIDTPPVSQYADALAVATVAGSVLVLSRTEATSFADMKDMLRRLAATQAKILGSVINKF